MALNLSTKLCLVLIIQVLMLSSINCRKQPCRLVWKTTDYLTPLQDDAVATHGNDNFIIRGKVTFWGFGIGKIMAFGRVSNSTGRNVAYLTSPVRPFSLEVFFYDILTNPNDCALEWTDTIVGGDIPNMHLAVSTDGYPESNCYIARIEADDKTQLGGYIKEDFSYFVNRAGIEEKKHAMYAQALLSSINLKIELRNVEFSAVVDNGDADLMGLDVIVNDSPVEIRQTVLHRKSVTERYTFEESNLFSSVTTWKVGLSIPTAWIGGVSVELGFQSTKANGESNSESKTHEEEKEVLSERTIVVPPYAAVEACSFTSFKDKAEMPYVAKGKYTVKGHSGADVRWILENDVDFPRDKIIGVEGDAVIVLVESSLQVSIPTKTTFTIAEIGSSTSCRMLMAKIYEEKRSKVFKKALNASHIID